MIMKQKLRLQKGFTLIEIAVVLVLIGLLLGSFIGSVSQRIETSQRENTKKQLVDIKTALLGFVSTTGRLPCPTTTIGNGEEQPTIGSTRAIACTLQHGFVPGKTLGISGPYNRDNLLVDSWKNPIRYSVTTANTNAFTSPPVEEDLLALPPVLAEGIKGFGIDKLSPDLKICTVLGCPSATETLISNAPFILLSLGKDGSSFIESIIPSVDPPTTDQGENAGEEKVAANVAGENLEYTVGNDEEFVSRSYSRVDSAAGLFDDLIVWESPYIIYSRMMEAGQLP